jgi:hypothetical protein
VKYANISSENIFSNSCSVLGGAGGDFIWDLGAYSSVSTLDQTEKTQYRKFETNIPGKGISTFMCL